MYALGFLCLVASAVALPAKLDARSPVIEYAMPVPIGYYTHPGSILRGNMAIADPFLAPLNAPLMLEDEPKKEKTESPESEKPESPESEKPEKPEEGKPITTGELEVAKSPIVHRFAWLPPIFNFRFPEFPLVTSNGMSYLQPQRLGAAPDYGYPAVL